MSRNIRIGAAAMAVYFAALCAAAACSSESGGDAGPEPISLEDASAQIGDGGQEIASDGGLPAISDGGISADDGGEDLPENFSVDFGFDVSELSSSSISDPETGRASASISSESAGLKTYVLTTNASIRGPLDGGIGVSNPRTVRERQESPRTRTGSDLFDALYALAIDELYENAVSSIRDGSFNNGGDVSCGDGGCFETGRDWHYVWTRDTAFAAALGIAALEPERMMRSLNFKLSERRDGSGSELQIVQDTGTGGSWPVSTDRVSWALGAEETLKWLSGSVRTDFRDRALEAIAATLEHDRATVYDASDGLYFGETSFLDWRENTYPAWMAADPSQIAGTKSLSTNLLHMKAMEVAAALSEEKGDASSAERYRFWASSLKSAVRSVFKGENGLWPSFIGPPLSGVPSSQTDALAVAFAVLFNAAEAEDASSAVAAYPHAGRGIPVIWPQQSSIPVYHNQSTWPFVSAFFNRAAAKTGNDRSFDFSVLSLLRGAAMNLSNMENFELLTGRNWTDLGDRSGPVVNSQRQLWSVGGYLSMVQHVIFGISAAESGKLILRPNMTASLRHSLFLKSNEIELENFPVGGGKVDVRLVLPPLSQEAARSGGFYEIQKIEADGGEIPADQEIQAPENGKRLQIVVTFAEDPKPRTAWNYVSNQAVRDSAWAAFAPETPCVPDDALSLSEGHPRLSLECATSQWSSSSEKVVFDIYRNGTIAASGIPRGTTFWIDEAWSPEENGTSCYTVRSRIEGRGGLEASHDSKAVCYWGQYGQSSWHIQEFGPSDFTFSGGSLSNEHNLYHLGNSWGADVNDYLEITAEPAFDGTHFIQLRYANATCALNTGITCAVKQVRVTEESSGAVVAEGYIALPSAGLSWDEWRDSTLFRVNLSRGKKYVIRIGGDGKSPSRSVNMSSFSHFANYTGNSGNGGAGGVLNVANIAVVKLLAMGH